MTLPLFIVFYNKKKNSFLLQNNNTAVVVVVVIIIITISTAIRIITVSFEALQIVLIVEIIGLCCPTL